MEHAAETVATIFYRSESGNFRILRQTIWDFERLYSVISETHRKNDDAIKSLLQLFFVFSFELKSNRLQADDLYERLDKLVVGRMSAAKSESPSPLVLASRRYPGVEIADTILSDHLLADILVKGIVNEIDIRASLDQSPYYAATDAEPAWRTLWHSFARTEKESVEALKTVDSQFSSREFTDTGEILHVFGLRLWLAEIGALEKSVDKIVEENKKYIDDLYTQKRFDLSLPEKIGAVQRGSYFGLGIYKEETPEFRELFEYFLERQRAAIEDRYPEQASNLLDEMKCDPELFCRRIYQTGGDDALYPNVPILESISPEVFVSEFLKLHPAYQRSILNALKARYDHGQLTRELSREKPWIESVRSGLETAAAIMPPISKDRITRSIFWSLTPVLKNIEEDSGS